MKLSIEHRPAGMSVLVDLKCTVFPERRLMTVKGILAVFLEKVVM